jgi:ADP-ribosylglycohydrolase
VKLRDINRADRDRRLGVMFGLAYGDALGRPTEFMKASALAKFGSPFQNRVGLNNPKQGIVTDDTQMSIAVAKAAARLGRATPAASMTHEFVAEFIAWKSDPKSFDGKRAPGAACTGAVSALKMGQSWLMATRPNSKGNGANMRVAPLALRTDWTWGQLAAAAQLQAAITHGHPTALAAADLTAAAVRMLLEGIAKPTEMLLEHLLAYAYDQRTTYHGDVLGSVWEAGMLNPPAAPSRGKDWFTDGDSFWSLPPVSLRRAPAATTPQQWIARGWDEMIDALLSVYKAPRMPKQDPCDIAGGGWVAEEALAAAVHTLVTFPGEPTDALRRAAFTDGDSDSIASITGALAGAAYGRSAFPSHWIENLEYRHELEGLTAGLTAAAR